MRSPTEHINRDSSGSELGVLAEVWRTPETTQRSLGRRLGISLGLTNHLIRKLVSKGHVRVVKANWRRRFYAITPQGMVQKVRLTLGFVSNFLGDYKSVKRILREELSPLALHKESRVAIYGRGDFGELVYLVVRDLGIEEVDVFGANGGGAASFLGMSVRDVSDLEPDAYDRVLIAELAGAEEAGSRLRDLGVAPESIVALLALPGLAQLPTGNSPEAPTEAD